jgi:very-short-patch-repair endonuclease
MPNYRIPEQQRRFAKRMRSDQTAAETRLWHEIRAGRLNGWKFKRQVPIGRYIVDFVCFEARLIVEVDGPVHDRPENRLHDAGRDADLRREGFRILRFNADIAPGRMLDDIAAALEGPPLPTPG